MKLSSIYNSHSIIHASICAFCKSLKVIKASASAQGSFSFAFAFFSAILAFTSSASTLGSLFSLKWEFYSFYIGKYSFRITSNLFFFFLLLSRSSTHWCSWLLVACRLACWVVTSPRALLTFRKTAYWSLVSGPRIFTDSPISLGCLSVWKSADYTECTGAWI